MDWHSSGLTASLIAALKNGLGPLARERSTSAAAGKHSRGTPDALIGVGGRVGLDGAVLARISRLRQARQRTASIYLQASLSPTLANGSWSSRA